jgi:hypothetical protein
MPSRPSYYTKRALPTVAATFVGVICAVLWIGGAVIVGSRLGEIWAGDKRAAA